MNVSRNLFHSSSAKRLGGFGSPGPISDFDRVFLSPHFLENALGFEEISFERLFFLCTEAH